jgi:hypothetical protein
LKGEKNSCFERARLQPRRKWSNINLALATKGIPSTPKPIFFGHCLAPTVPLMPAQGIALGKNSYTGNEG